MGKDVILIIKKYIYLSNESLHVEKTCITKQTLC